MTLHSFDARDTPKNKPVKENLRNTPTRTGKFYHFFLMCQEERRASGDQAVRRQVLGRVGTNQYGVFG
jgi:hypothetical protein